MRLALWVPITKYQRLGGRSDRKWYLRTQAPERGAKEIDLSSEGRVRVQPMTSFNPSHLLKTPPLNIVTLVAMFEHTNRIWGMVIIVYN